MKPKTQLHGIVNKLANRLRKPTKKQLSWIYNKVFYHYAYVTKKSIISLDTGKEIDSLGKLKPLKGKKRTLKDSSYVSIWEVNEGFQVLRYFLIKRYLKAGFKACYDVDEVFQHWISPDGKQTIRAISCNPMGCGYTNDGWSMGTVMEIRTPNNRHFLWDVPIVPGRKILKNIRRNGFKGDFHKFHPADLFGILLRNPIAETFIKSKQFDMLRLLGSNEKKFTRYWSSYKICMRHKFKIDDYSTWIDHMQLLEHFKYDLHNPKFICSPTFIEDHNRLRKKKQKIERAIWEEKMRLDKIKQEEEDRKNLELAKKSLELKKKLFNVKFSDGIIDIVVLSDIEDFKREGEILDHCVYENKYYEKPNSLILSARRRNKRLETIEFDLKNMQMIQSRGYQNQDSKYHNEIIELMNKNINLIKQTA